jgi:K+-sensing histidine kinase KdpD
MNDTEFGELLSAVAHDLRTPLSVVYGFAKTLERAGGLDEQQQRFIGQIEGAAADMDRMIANVSAIGHAVSGRWQPALEPIATADLATAALAVVTARTDGRAVSGREPVAPAVVQTEPDRAARAIALIAEAALRLDPNRPAASLGAESNAIAIGPFAPELLAVVTTPGRDVALEAARVVLTRLGGHIEPAGDDALVRLPT